MDEPVEIEKPKCSGFEIYSDENEEFKDEIFKANSTERLKPFQEGNVLSFKFYGRRRLSQMFSNLQTADTDLSNSTISKEGLCKFFPLLFMQGMLKNSEPGKGLESFPEDERKELVLKIFETLLNVVKASLNTPLEEQIIKYCHDVLEEVGATVRVVAVVYSFLEFLLSDDPLFKQAALVMLSLYCNRKCINSALGAVALQNLLTLYNNKNLKILKLAWKTVDGIIKGMKFVDQVIMVSDACLAIKRIMYFSTRVKQYLPGLCHSEGFASVFWLYERVMWKGKLKEKRIAAQALRQLILFSSEEALYPSINSIVTILIYILLRYKNQHCNRTKTAFIDALTTLITKVGVKLKFHFQHIQYTLLSSMKYANHSLHLKCIKGFCCLVRFDDQVEELYAKIMISLRKEGCSTKKRMLVLLRCVIKSACVPIPESLRRKMLILVISMLDFKDTPCRIAAAGCVGTILGFLPPEECVKVLRLYFLGIESKSCRPQRVKRKRKSSKKKEDNEGCPTCLIQSKCTVLMVALKESPEKLLLQEVSEEIHEKLLSYLKTDKVNTVLSAIKACGYLMLFKCSLPEKEINDSLLVAFCEIMNRTSEDVKQTFALVINFVASRIILPMNIVREIVPYLLIGIADESNKVKSSSQFALVAVLDLYNQDQIAQVYLNTLETRAKESFLNIMDNLKEIAKQPKPKEEELDYTLT